MSINGRQIDVQRPIDKTSSREKSAKPGFGANSSNDLQGHGRALFVISRPDNRRPGRAQPTLKTILISDLHLTAASPDRTRMFIDFAIQNLMKTSKVYVLGDLFDFWLGDDGAELLGHQMIIDILKRISDSGTSIEIMHGNRDFMIGSSFCEQVDARLLTDPTVVDLYGRQVILCHGDHLCTDDSEHQTMRNVVRSESWQTSMLAKSLDDRMNFAKEIRLVSDQAKKNKSAEIMDVNAGTVLDEFERLDTFWMIHGHTHRPALHYIRDNNGQIRTRMVLGDWLSSPSWLSVTESGLTLESGSGRAGAYHAWSESVSESE